MRWNTGPIPGNNRTNYLWNLDRVIAPNENAGAFKLMLISYQQDLNTVNGQTTVRDSGISKITYGYSASTSSIDAVVGTIDFSYLAPPYSTNYNCDGTPPDGKTTTMRCDDPISRTNAGITVDPPLVMSTMSLQAVTSYVGSDSNSAQKAYRYDFTYDDTPFNDCNDDYTQYAQYCAGEHLLTSVTPTIYQNGTAHKMPLLSLSYTTGLHNTYYDTQNKIQNGSWQYSQQTYWRYLSKYVDTLTGVGGTVSYNTAYSNTHGTPNDTTTGDDRYDPLYCSTHSDCTGNYLHPDDHAWTVQVVTSITAPGSDSSSLSAAKTTYSYRLAKTGTYSGNSTYCYPAGTDSDCVGDNWILNSDNNWQDYFDAEFRGFNTVTIAGPASGEERVDSYYSTKGWNTASSDGSNYDSSHLYEEDAYGIYGGTQEVLLSITQNQYTGSCPLSNLTNCTTTLPNACNGNLNPYYNPCEVMVTASRTTTYDTTASYDSMGRITQLVDPERGTHSYTYDADSHLIEDVSGTRTLGYSYDLLGRLGCIQDQAPTLNATGACGSGVNPFVINTYDADPSGVNWGSANYAKGRLTQSFAITYYPAPDNTQGKVTENMQYDTRGRLITERMQLTATGSTLTFPSFPTYQMTLSYNDANQLTTTTTSSTNPSGLGYTTTNVYDTTGNLSGLSNNTTQTTDLATLTYDTHAQVSQINFITSNGSSQLANEQFSYDADLRPLTASAVWLSGSGTSGGIYSQTLTYDPVGNVASSSTTQAVVSGATNSGGSETEIYCYDGQNRLVWAGNSGTPQGTGSGTCGSGTPSNTLSGATYSNQYVYTHLGQLWQGAYNGPGSYQYLYCNSSQPHQLTGLYPTGTTCSTTSGKTQTYGASYDSWGNMTTRTATGTGGTTATLSYDGQDHLVRWNDTKTTTNEEWYMYDASGQRVLRRSQTGTGNSNTKYTITAFGLEDHIYDGGGSNLNNKYYYSLAGRLIGVNTGSTNFLFTDALGSVIASITNTANSASVKGNQVYGPYGNSSYSKGTMGTTKGYTGQYNDSLTQLDYYGARYYDPLVGVFLSADTVQGNLEGMNPYSYGIDNPETFNDPSGQSAADGGNWFSQAVSTIEQGVENALDPQTDPFLQVVNPETDPALPIIVETGMSLGVAGVLGIGVIAGVLLGGAATVLTTQNLSPATLPTPIQTTSTVTVGPFSGGQSLTLPTQTGGGQIPPGGKPPAPPATAPEPCSFTPSTEVTTAQGKEPIGKLHVGEKVLAYNPKTHKMELQPVLHVWKHSDTDLVDLTITTVTTLAQNHKVARKSEVVHTTSEHPFFTKEQGFVPAGKLKPGMHILRADGSFGIVTGWKAVHATKVMYNLEVAQDHTFVVGDGQWVVHNSCGPNAYRKLRGNLAKDGRPVQPGQNPHHLVPCQLASHDLINATNGAFDMNAAYNGRPLWNKANSDLALGDMEPYHASSPRYTSHVKSLMDGEYQRLVATGQLNPTTAFNSLISITNGLNSWIDTIGWFGALQGEACPLY